MYFILDVRENLSLWDCQSASVSREWQQLNLSFVIQEDSIVIRVLITLFKRPLHRMYILDCTNRTGSWKWATFFLWDVNFCDYFQKGPGVD